MTIVTKKVFLIFFTIVLVLLGLSFTLQKSLFQRWSGQQYFGVVTHVGKDEFVITNRTENKIKVRVSGNTKFVFGRHRLLGSFLLPRQEVLVVGSLEDNVVSAHMVRVMSKGGSK